MNMNERTDVEERAVAALRDIAWCWPETLWLYTEADTLCVTRLAEDGRRAMTETGDVDQRYILETIELVRG